MQKYYNKIHIGLIKLNLIIISKIFINFKNKIRKIKINISNTQNIFFHLTIGKINKNYKIKSKSVKCEIIF